MVSPAWKLLWRHKLKNSMSQLCLLAV